MNRKVVAVVLGVMLFFLVLSLAGAAYIHHLRTSQVEVVRPEVNVTGGTVSTKDFGEMFKDDADPKVQARPASAPSRP